MSSNRLDGRLARRTLLVASIGFALTPRPAPAQIATEFTQLLNNFELAGELAQQVKAVEQLVITYKNQVMQLKEQLRAGLGIGGVQLTDVLRIQADLENYQGALRGLGLDLRSLGNVFDTRLTEARLQNLTIADYMRNEQARIDQGSAAAKARVERERRVMEQVSSDIVLVRQYGDAIPQTEGIHQAQGLMNQQANLMLQQLNKLVLMQAEAQGSDKAAEEADAAARRAAALARRQAMRDAQDAIDQRNLTILRLIGGAR